MRQRSTTGTLALRTHGGLSRNSLPTQQIAQSMLYYSMRHRTQLYLDDSQYLWLKQQAGPRGSIAAVVRELIEAARSQRQHRGGDALIRYLVEEPAAHGKVASTVETIDRDLYG